MSSLDVNNFNDIDYVQIAKNSRKKYNCFANSFFLYNNDSKKKYFLKTYNEVAKERFYYIRDRFNLLHSLEIQKGKIAIFLTSTVPSKFHNNYDIDGAYRALVSFRYDLQNNFKINSKRVNCKNINVIEPHKSMIPHQHSIFYVDAVNVNLFLKHYYRTLRHHGFNKKGQDFKILDNAQYSIIYLLKYVEKTLNNEDLKIAGWFKHHKFRQFQTSNIKNFNIKIWRLMMSNKKYFFKDDKYDFLNAYNLLDVVSTDIENAKDINDDSFKIYKIVNKISKTQIVANDNYFLLYNDSLSLPSVHALPDKIKDTQYSKYIYFCHKLPKFYIQEITPSVDTFKTNYDSTQLLVIKHDNCIEVQYVPTFDKINIDYALPDEDFERYKYEDYEDDDSYYDFPF